VLIETDVHVTTIQYSTPAPPSISVFQAGSLEVTPSSPHAHQHSPTTFVLFAIVYTIVNYIKNKLHYIQLNC